MDAKTEEKINQLTQLEQNAHHFLNQRQSFNSQLMEIESAIKEIGDISYKIIGNVMVKSNKEDLVQELNQKKEMLSLRVKNIEKQEQKIKEKASLLQKEIMEKIGDKDGESK